MRPMTFAPTMFADVWIASRINVMMKMVECDVGSQSVPNQLWNSVVT